MQDQETGVNEQQLANQEYDFALKAKYAGDWEESLRRNERAQELCPGDEATLWNLAIAATALHRWEKARPAWRALGIEVLEDEGEVHTLKAWACVRLQPNGAAEVVWGTRIDPARIRVENVPLPTSGRRYGDVILNDGAPEGKRTADGVEYPVFNELTLWNASSYSTYEAQLVVPDDEAAESLERICKEQDIAVEDWATLRRLCAACSRGNPGEHECSADTGAEHWYGFGSRSQNQLFTLLQRWKDLHDGAAIVQVRLVLVGSDG